MAYDVLIIGSGIAGLLTALKLPGNLEVAVITKGKLADSETSFAQGGISCVTSPSDSFASHIRDSLKTGAGISKERIVGIVVREAPERLNDLISIGVEFTRRNSGGYDLHLEGGHSHRRVVHAKDLTGKVIEDALIRKVIRRKNVTRFENHIAVNLIKKNSRCWGAYVLTGNGVKIFASRATLLATGGAGKCYLYTSNPDVSTGDGVAMAYRAGCSIKNMEFVQFHPTCLYHPEAKSFLISESVRGEGARLFTKSGERFMRGVHPMK